MTTSVRVVLMTAPDQQAGEKLGATLVEERLATCANVVPSLVTTSESRRRNTGSPLGSLSMSAIRRRDV